MTYKVIFYDMTRPLHGTAWPDRGRWRSVTFATRAVALAFFLDANLACFWEGQRKVAESVMCKQ